MNKVEWIFCPNCDGDGDERPEDCCLCEHTGRVKKSDYPILTMEELIND